MDLAILKDADPTQAVWLILLWVILSLFSGRIVTRREADAMREDAKASKEALGEALRQNTILMQSTAPVVESTFKAIRQTSEGETS